ncbi:hypothetical protein NDU88_004891 [Pleurodeles waltl]|uniref:Uncharacterized protein n=1 Tax=Pleurodeles waltl TaxID=8319 RepID=A0AAV7SK42_PLEWA|nr:hypothetical protein NDU88_004891 [Pleurodeles waltl]
MWDRVAERPLVVLETRRDVELLSVPWLSWRCVGTLSLTHDPGPKLTCRSRDELVYIHLQCQAGSGTARGWKGKQAERQLPVEALANREAATKKALALLQTAVGLVLWSMENSGAATYKVDTCAEAGCGNVKL